MVLNKKKYNPRPKTEKEIRNEMFKDLLIFVAQYVGILAVAYGVFWMVDVEIETIGNYLQIDILCPT